MIKLNNQSGMVPRNFSETGFFQRRDFLKTLITSISGIAMVGKLQAQSTIKTPIPLGLDAHSRRGMKWKAQALIEYAAEQKLDAVLFNGLNYFKSLKKAYLQNIKKIADSHNIKIYIGAGSICESSKKFSKKNKNAKSLLVEGVRAAKILGSPVVNVRIGNIKDRYTPGGIKARIADVVKVLKASKNLAKEAGIKFAFENHAGDLRSEEVLQLIKAVGTDTCGAMLDPGNAVWAMEDPMKQIQMLGPYVLCTSVRDYMVWESEEGATFQWTAIGEGLMDVPAFTQYMAKLCPGVPLFVETISNSARPIPFRKKEFWKGFPDLKKEDITDFLALCRRGRALEIVTPPKGVSRRTFKQQHQQAEFEKSIKYLRNKCGIGINHK